MSETITAPTMTPTTRERVERGIAWLDQTVPAWRDTINRRTLNMASPMDCVLGQTFAAEATRDAHPDDFGYLSGFDYALTTYGTCDDCTHDCSRACQEKWVIRHGFEADNESYDVLVLVWLHLMGVKA